MDESLLMDSASALSDGGSSDFAPIVKPKAKPAAKKAAPSKPKAAPKAAPKKMKQTTIKPKAAAPKKRSKPESDEENSDMDDTLSMHDDSILSTTPPSAKRQKKDTAPKKSSGKPLKSITNESVDLDGANEPRGKKSGSEAERYQMLTHLQHILKRPDTYIGSVERDKKQMWVFNSTSGAMETREVSFVPGLYKIFDEILVNAADNKQRDKNMNEIKVTIDRESGEISIRNNGRGIPIEIHKEGMYVPELIFGHLLTSSNYNDHEAKVTGGRNGFGAKLCNVFSTQFTIETADSRSQQKYKQIWTKNMSQMGKAKITAHKGDDYTKVTFSPDFAKFGMSGIDEDFEALVMRRVYDMAATCTGVRVFLNGDKIKINSFKKYMEMYTKAINTEQSQADGTDKQVILTETPNERWEIGFAVSDGSFQQVSFVNSIATSSGGTHVNYVADQIVHKLLESLKKKNKKGVTLKPNQIRNHIFLFVNCLIVNPSFASQTKEQLTTKPGQFGSKCEISEKFLKALEKTDAMKNILNFAQHKADQALQKSDGNKRTRMHNPKLTDANRAGTKDGWKCTLILTEGDSAAGLALAGRAVVDPDHFGVFPLRGKLLNVRDASIDQISKNQEIQNIKKFMGLQHKKEYLDTKGLRYGHLMIMTDQDHDGSHIKGLLINFLQVSFPSLLKLEGFLMEFITPIVKVWKGDPKHPRAQKTFFTMPEYEAWKELPGNSKGWEHKYYKGLGTSTSQDAQVYFRDLDRHLKEFHTMKEQEQELIELAFSKKKADARKNWLRDFQPGTYLDMSAPKISYDDFINKELILFSMADNMRSIPSMVDGLKPGQRKVLYTCFRRNLKKDIKVVELAGLVSGLTHYPYGETSLQQTIVGLAQNFVGSNNINTLEPSGNFGSRLQGGQDAASARYIYTRLSPFARRIYHAADEPLLTYNEDDGKTIEPHMYVPVVPMILINGADGIGTGWSSSIPNYKPEDIVHNLKRRMAGSSVDDMLPMVPWFKDWNGQVEDLGGDRYKFTGTVRQTGDNEVEITELPIRVWTQDFKEKLEETIKAEKVPSFIKTYDEYNTDSRVHFIIKMEDKHMKISLEKGLEEQFKLYKSIATSNLVAFDSQQRIHKYNSVLEIMEEFYTVRLKHYEKRKQYQLGEMQKELEKLSNQARFVKMVVDGKLTVAKKKKKDLVTELRGLKFTPFPKVGDARKKGEFEAVVEEEADEADDVGDAEPGQADYDYLLGMAIWSLTYERIEKLKRQIGDKEVEIDTLIKLSPKDIWMRDLDDFLEEWRIQVDDDRKRAKKIANMGRRASAKLRVGASKPGKGKKRKAGDSDDDSDGDFAVSKTKKAVAKGVQPKPTNLLGFLAKATAAIPKPSSVAKPEPDVITIDGAADNMDLDEPADKPAPISKGRAAKTKAVTKRPVIDSDDDDDDDVFEAVAMEAQTKIEPQPAKVPARQARTAAKKQAKYVPSDDSDDDNGDDLLGDVSNMVKGINGSSNDASSRMLFTASASRPASSQGFTKGLGKIPKPAFDKSDDDTDYNKLIPKGSPQRPAARTVNDTIISGDEDDSLAMPKSRASLKPGSKPAAKAASKPAAAKKVAAKKAAAALAEPKKPVTLSPAAKAYAAKQAKAKSLPKAAVAPAPKPRIDTDSDGNDDELDALANDILSDGDGGDSDAAPVPAPTRATSARPSRRAAATTKKPAYVVSDESEDDASEPDFDDDDDDSE